jgi:hypothetical protein
MGGGGGIGGLVGGGLGFMVGGPAGAAIGAGLGMGAGSALMPGPSAPATPDYTGAAQATAQGNLEAARAATAANRVNQITPYGNLRYTQSGTDPYGNPMWTATQSIDPSLQGAVDKSKSAVSNFNFSQFNPQGLPSIGINPGETMTDSIMRRLQPQIAMQNKQFDATMANQGIPVGSEAYMNAKRAFDQQQNDLMTSAVVQGTQTGLAANQQQYGQQQGTYTTNLNAPFNYASNVKAFTAPGYINPSQQATTTGADILGATQAGYNANMGAYNAQQAQNAGMMSGLMGLGGTLGAASILRG